MRIKNVKPGDIIRYKTHVEKNLKFSDFYEEEWKVVKVYKHLVLTRSVKCNKIKRCFSYGDLVILGLEAQTIY